MSHHLTRRAFSKMLLSATVFMGSSMLLPETGFSGIINKSSGKTYKGPNVIIIRYGGGVRRRETIDMDHTYSPFMMNVLAPQATLYNNMEISNFEGQKTDHAQGTLNILTGRYNAFKNIGDGILGNTLQPTHPTLFEYFRKAYDVGIHESLIINGENHPENDSMNFGTSHDYGVEYKSELLSYHKYRAFVLKTKLYNGDITKKEQDELDEIISKSSNLIDPDMYPPSIQSFWQKWQRYYGDDRAIIPRGDSMSTEVALWALRDLRPKLMLINYEDPDHVHWGAKSHYKRGIMGIDQGIQQLVKAVETDPFYKDNTVFVIVPDCGRTDNLLMDIPYQHHFNTRSTREIFAMISGAGIEKNQIIDHAVDQTSIAATVAKIMGFEAEMAEGSVLEEAFT